MVGFFIDPERRVIKKVILPVVRYQAINKIRKLLDSRNLSQQPGLEGLDLLVVVPDKIFINGVAGFRYKNNENEILAFGKAIIMRYDIDEGCVEDAEASLKQLKEYISFLSVEETDAISQSERNDCYINLLLTKRNI